MKFKMMVFGLVAVSLTACVSIPQSTAPSTELTSNKDLKINKTITNDEIVPVHSYPIAETGFQLVQTQGGSIFLGPILGSMNISKNSKEMANKIKSDAFGVVPYELSKTALLKQGFIENNNARLDVTPFAFVQKCDDGNFRLAIVYHVQDLKSKWYSRYTYHIEKPVKVEEFPAALKDQYFSQEFTVGAETLAKLMQRDFAGQLPVTGKKYNVGSLNLIGEKMGGIGIYTQPEEMFFQNAAVVEETDTSVIVRMQGTLQADPAFGGLAFGVHYLKKSILHKFEPTK